MLITAVIIYNIMTWNDIAIAAPTILTILSIAGVLLGVIRWLVKHYLEEMKSELRPNGGGSIKDQVNRLEKRHDELDSKVDRIVEILITGRFKRPDTEVIEQIKED